MTILNLIEMAEKFSKWVENTGGKRKSCSLRAIAPLPSVFSKDFYCRYVNTRACLGKGEPFYLICQFWAPQIQKQIKIWCQKYWQMGIQFSDWVENIAEKEEIDCYEQFLFFAQCFQKAVCCWCIKMSIYGVKG